MPDLLRLVLRPAARQPETWGEQTDVPESADWYNAGYLMIWGSNVPQTRTPDAHFYHRGPLQGHQERRSISPDYAEATKFADLWLHPKQGTDAALALAMGHVILREFHLDRTVPYFEDYVRRYTDLPMLVRLVRKGERYVPDRMLRADDFADGLGEANNPAWKTVGARTARATRSCRSARSASAGASRASGTWSSGAATARRPSLQLSLIADGGTTEAVAFPYFGGAATNGFTATEHPDVVARNVPVRRLALKDGETLVATVFDLLCANYGLDRGLGGDGVASDYDAGRAVHAGLGRAHHRRAARPDHPCRARVRHQRREDQRPLAW